MKTVLFPGSFDPFTLGHADIVSRGLALCDEVIIAIGHNVEKPGWISIAKRVEALRHLYAEEKRVRVEQYTGLTVDFAKEAGATAILRGVRNIKDFEYEREQADINRSLSGIETILLYAEPQYSSISSSMVRELQHFGVDVSAFLPKRSKK